MPESPAIDDPESSDGPLTLSEVMSVIIDIVSRFRPDLVAEIERTIEEAGDVDLDGVIGTVQSVLERHEIDASPLLDRLAEAGLMGVSSEIDPVPAPTVPEVAERVFRVSLVEACRGVLADADCDELLVCGFCQLVDGESFEHQMYRTVVNMVANGMSKKIKRLARIASAIELLRTKGIANPGVEF